MRPSEVCALDVEDVVRKPTGVLINIRRSKTDRDGRGQLVGVARGDNRVTDPIRALDEWLKADWWGWAQNPIGGVTSARAVTNYS